MAQLADRKRPFAGLSMRMMPLLLLVMISGPASATPCTLTPADLESLQLSDSKIKDQAQVDALEPTNRPCFV
jgi:hypothetical protein